MNEPLISLDESAVDEDPLAVHLTTSSSSEQQHHHHHDLLLDATEAPDDSTHDETQQEPATNTIDFSIIWGSTVNLCSATLGAGILSVPYSFYQAGLVWGMVLLAVSALATVSSISILSRSVAYHDHHTTYEGLTRHVLGRRVQLVMEVCLVLFCGGCAVAYCIAVGDILQLSGLVVSDTNNRLLLLLVWSVTMLPLSLLRTMKSLQCSSTIGMASIGTLVFAAAVHLLQDRFDPAESSSEHHRNVTFVGQTIQSDNNNNHEPSWQKLLWPANGVLSVLQACPIILFAFSCQVNCCAIYEELPCPSLMKLSVMKKVTKQAVCVCSALYASIALLGLADFGHSVDPNILNNYAPPVGIMQVATAAMAAAVIMAFPLNIFPARVTLTHVWEQWHTTTSTTEPNATLTAALLEDAERDADERVRADDETTRQANVTQDQLEVEEGDATTMTTTAAMPWKQHIFLSTLLAGSALGLALIVPDISIVFGLLGGTTSSVLGFCIPGALGLQLVREQEEPERGLWLASWSLVVGGLLVGVLTTAVTISVTLFPSSISNN